MALTFRRGTFTGSGLIQATFVRRPYAQQEYGAVWREELRSGGRSHTAQMIIFYEQTVVVSEQRQAGRSF